MCPKLSYFDVFFRPEDIPSYVQSFATIRNFFQRIGEALRGIPSSEKVGQEVESQRKKREVELDSFGEFGAAINDIANAVLNTVTIWMYR